MYLSTSTVLLYLYLVLPRLLRGGVEYTSIFHSVINMYKSHNINKGNTVTIQDKFCICAGDGILAWRILAWGIVATRLEKLQKKAIRLITNSKYIAHTNPLFKRLQLLKIVDIFKLRVLKFYYNLYNGLLPAYFNVFLDFITREPPRVLRNPLIHQPVLRTKYAECNLLFQLIKVINSLKNDPCDTILKKVHLRTHSYKGFAFNVTHVFLNAYDPICRLRVCYVCN